MWILKSIARWRDLPSRYGNWNSIYHNFCRWCSLDLFDSMLKLLNVKVREATLLEIESTFCKALMSAFSAWKDQEIGSSRGDKNPKVHDSEPNITLLKDIKRKVKTMMTDKAYRCEQIRVFLAEHVAVTCIPDKANFRIKHDFDSQLYKQRNMVERFFQQIKNYLHSL